MEKRRFYEKATAFYLYIKNEIKMQNVAYATIVIYLAIFILGIVGFSQMNLYSAGSENLLYASVFIMIVCLLVQVTLLIMDGKRKVLDNFTKMSMRVQICIAILPVLFYMLLLLLY